MSKATTVTFVQDMAVVSSNAAAIQDYYEAQIAELGKTGVLSAVVTQAGSVGVRKYAAPAQAIELYAVFYGNVHTPLVGLRELEAIAADWQTQPIGVPQIATVEGEGDKEYSFFPTPSASETITQIISQLQTDAPLWLEGALAMGALAREFSRETAQQDANFSQGAQFMSTLLMKLVL